MICDQCAVRRGLADGTFEQCGLGQVKAKGLGRELSQAASLNYMARLRAAHPTMS